MTVTRWATLKMTANHNSVKSAPVNVNRGHLKNEQQRLKFSLSLVGHI